MTPCRNLLCAALLAMLGTGTAAAHELPEGIPVQNVDDIGRLQRFSIALEMALVPGIRVLAPLYAYRRENFNLDEVERRHLVPDGFDWVAVVVHQPSPVAYFFRSISAAHKAVDTLCGEDRDCLIAIASQIQGDNAPAPEGRFISRDVRRIDKQLRQEPAR